MDRQPIYIVSGGSGETAHRMVQAALTQFAKGESSALVRRFQNVRSQEDLDRVLQLATDKRAVIIHTTVSREMRDYLDKRCAELRLTLDYVMEAYRDSRIGRWLYTADGRKVLRDAGFRRVVATPSTSVHRTYLQAMGFVPEDDALVRALD